MKSNKTHIGILTALHIVLLLFPLAAKIAHHHTGQLHNAEHQHASAITNYSGHCYVCDFECLPFEKTENYYNKQEIIVLYEFNEYCTPKPFLELFNFSSLRAPPVA
ncbi:MAG: hypothetical protein HC905_21245 [Bacteroidales bacterium]|nr:hypothetical protein [Bacteroidales bacterium]